VLVGCGCAVYRGHVEALTWFVIRRQSRGTEWPRKSSLLDAGQKRLRFDDSRGDNNIITVRSFFKESPVGRRATSIYKTFLFVVAGSPDRDLHEASGLRPCHRYSALFTSTPRLPRCPVSAATLLDKHFTRVCLSRNDELGNQRRCNCCPPAHRLPAALASSFYERHFRCHPYFLKAHPTLPFLNSRSIDVMIWQLIRPVGLVPLSLTKNTQPGRIPAWTAN
jgi:hypothetical protein